MHPYDSEFQANPYLFASKKPLTISQGAFGPYTHKTDHGLVTLDLHQVKAPDRVGFAEVIKNTDIKNDYGILIDHHQTKKNQFPIFWLPYEANYTTRCTLRLSKKNPKMDQEGVTVYPHYFATVGLTGCTISVVGDPQEPTVYHSGQANITPGPNDEEQDTEEGRNTVTARHIVDLVTRSESAFPKHSGHPNLTHLFPTEYGRGIIDSSYADTRIAQETSNHFFVKGRVGVTDGATVIGTRSIEDGTWQFYCQEWSHLIFSRSGLFSDVNEKVIRRIYKFWPGATEIKPAAIHVFPKSK